MTDNTQPEAGSTHIIRYALEMGLLWIDGDGRDKVREALDALDTLENQIEAIGAGGVSGPLAGQPQAVPDLSNLTERGAKAWTAVDAQGLREGRWYMVTHDGVATLCEDRRDAEKEAKDSDMAWPHSGPHRAVQLVEASTAGFTAADMATASAQGFRDGAAYVAASVGSELVYGDVLPPVGSRVFIRHGRDNDAHACIVTGYYAWGDLKGDKRLHRVFVRMVYEGTSIEQARMLCDCYPTAGAALAAQPSPTPQADSQPAPVVDGCTDPYNCKRCMTHPNHRGSMEHAGIPAHEVARAPADSVTAPAGPSKSLPYEPTSAMLIAARERDPALPIETVRAIYWSMWRTAPTPPAQAADSVQEDAADPLQGAANWLVKAHSGLETSTLAGKLSIGYNRAKRLHDAAIAARKQGANHD